jgi:hypothetical protein
MVPQVRLVPQVGVRTVDANLGPTTVLAMLFNPQV